MYKIGSIILLLAFIALSDAQGMRDRRRDGHRRDCDFGKAEAYTKCSRAVHVTPREGSNMEKVQIESIMKSCISNRSELVDMLFRKAYCKGIRYSPFPYYSFTRRLERLSVKFDRFLVKVDDNVDNEAEITIEDEEIGLEEIEQSEPSDYEDGFELRFGPDEGFDRRGGRRGYYDWSGSDEWKRGGRHGGRGPCRSRDCGRRRRFPHIIMKTLDEASQCFIEQVIPDLISNNALNLDALKQWIIANNDETDVTNDILTSSVDACSDRVNGFLVAPLGNCIVDECVAGISNVAK